MKGFREFMMEEPDWLPYLKGGHNLDPNLFKDHTWKPVGKVWRAFKVDWLDDLERQFGTVLLDKGQEHQYERPPYSAWSKDERGALAFWKHDLPQHSFQILLSCDSVKPANILVDFTQLPEYDQYKYKVEAEVVLYGPLQVKIERFESPYDRMHMSVYRETETIGLMNRLWWRDEKLGRDYIRWYLKQHKITLKSADEATLPTGLPRTEYLES